MNETQEFEIHWLEEYKKEILERNYDEIVLSTGKTPSGSIHLGILREITICDCLKRLLLKEGKKVRFLLFFDSMDAAKKFPSYIPKSHGVHLGKPFSDIPCPVEGCGCESYAHHWGNELVESMKAFGIDIEVHWTHELYETPEMKDKIKISLDNTEKIREIIMKNILPTLDEKGQEDYKIQMESWFPVMAVCSKCGTTQYNDKKEGKIFANRIVEYHPDTSEIVYECPNPKCNNTERATLDAARLKLNWRVDWPAKWAMFHTTCEPAGKDHSVKGGSYDTGLDLCKEVFGYMGPIKLPYEWLRLGDQDMSTSGGIVFNPKEYLKIGALPEAYRHLIVKTKPTTHISYRVENLPQMFDDYERFEKIYYGHEDVEKDELDVVKYLFPLTQVDAVPKKMPARIPYRFAVIMAQIQEILVDAVIKEKCNEVAKKTSPRDDVEDLSLEEIKNALSGALYWVNTYAPKQYRFNVSKNFDKEIKKRLNDEQILALKMLLELFKSKEFKDDQELQNAIFTIAKEKLKISPKKVFQAIYLVFLGTKHGPRLGPFLIALDKKFVVKRLEEATK
ncbi:MAG: lysine--tRNA ligase [Candidatus Hodarchaeota archaeon]